MQINNLSTAVVQRRTSASLEGEAVQRLTTTVLNSRPRRAHREHGGTGAQIRALTVAAVESKSNTIGPTMMIAASGQSRTP